MEDTVVIRKKEENGINKTGGLVKVDDLFPDGRKRYAVTFNLNGRSFLLFPDGEITLLNSRKHSVQLVCYTVLGTDPSYFRSLKQVKEDYKEGRYEVVFSGVKKCGLDK